MVNNKIKIGVISNVVFEPYLYEEIRRKFESIQYVPQLFYINYNDYISCKLDSKYSEFDLMIVILNFESFYPNFLNQVYLEQITSRELKDSILQRCRNLFFRIKQNTTCNILWFGFEDYCYNVENIIGNLILGQGLVDDINIELNKIVTCTDCVFIDFKKLIAKVGINNAYNIKEKYRWNAPYSKNLIMLVCEEVLKQCSINAGLTKKCIVLDCDNVLWGGILSEDGIEGINLGGEAGRFYQEFQQFLFFLYYHGIILTVCSKNDEKDVLKVFQQHSGMVLREEHIACFKVNWNTKSSNIERISQELNISLNSMVFIDDSMFEIGLVKMAIPNITAILFERDSIYRHFECFSLKNELDKNKVEDRNRTYKTNIKREELREKSSSYSEYLRSLEMKIDIHFAEEMEFNRIVELTQRTNKCTNGIRYTIQELKKRVEEENYFLYAVTVEDKFSNLGLVGVLGIYNDTLDLFFVSCRVLGRGIEDKMLNLVKENNVCSYKFIFTHNNSEWNSKLKQITC